MKIKIKLLIETKIPNDYLVSALGYIFAVNEVVRDYIEKLNYHGVESNQGSCPEIYNEKIFKSFKVKKLPNAHELGKTSICLPSHDLMNDKKLI